MSKKKLINLSPQTKRNLGNIFGSLVSNQKVIDCAKELPFWPLIVFFLLSIFLPVIPNMVQISKTSGSNFIRNTNYGTDIAFEEITDRLYQDGYVFKVNNQNELLAYDKNNKVVEEINGDIDNKYNYIDSNTNQYILRFIYTNKVDQELTDLYKEYFSSSYTRGYHEKKEDTSLGVYIPSFIIMGKKSTFTALYKINSASAGSALTTSNYNYVEKDINILNKLEKTNEVKGTEKRTKDIFNNWCTFYDEIYIAIKNNTMLTSTFIYIGVYAGLIIFMGALVFLLTRGKNNFFHYLSYWTCTKISVYAALSPALLAMVLGFFITQFGQIFFILLFGVRIMWLTMKQLKPQVPPQQTTKK